ncbi:hypothetical protein XCR1_940016 [Xenorhabdus cabanillasii JM26]|uniref:Uncharacterized protein n=1 Tax=Xenorhabdus cabanillasii JM26 TaxID=1427517 RepID=W1JCP8_9GAMM|nr:hypothetical protein XCR1_940016 [Xenorhabdus cabanillasii JM26]
MAGLKIHLIPKLWNHIQMILILGNLFFLSRIMVLKKYIVMDIARLAMVIRLDMVSLNLCILRVMGAHHHSGREGYLLAGRDTQVLLLRRVILNVLILKVSMVILFVLVVDFKEVSEYI